MNGSRHVLVAAAMAFVFCGAGCASSAPAAPEVTFEQVAAEGGGALDRILAELPDGTEVTVREQSAPYPCGEGSMYAQRRDAYVPADFDVEAFIEALPKTLGDELVLEEQLPLDDPSLSFTMPAFGDAGVSVTGFLPPDRPGISLLVTSRCSTADE